MWKIWYVHPHFSLAAVYIELLSVHSGNLNSLKYSNSLEWPIFFKHRCNCLMFWWKHNTYFYIKRLSKHRRKWGFLVVLFLWYSTSKLFSFRVSSSRRTYLPLERFHKAGALAEKLMWSRFLWVSVYRSAKPECAQLFLWLFLSLIFCAYYYSHNNDNIFQLHFISASQEQSYFALKCMQNSPKKVFNPPLWMEELAHHILSQSICIMGCLIYRVVWCVPTNHLKVLWGQIVSFFKKKCYITF